MHTIFDVALPLVAGLLGLVGGILVYLESLRGKNQIAETSKIATAVEAEAEARRAEALEGLVGRLPADVSVDELRQLVRDALQAASDEGWSDKTGGRDSTIRSLVEGLVTSYNRQALSQASIQFWFSLTVATAGVIYSGTLIALYLTSTASVHGIDVVLRGVPGFADMGVAAVFFRQAEQTRQRATDVYDRLRADENRRQAIDLVAAIDDAGMRSIVRAQLALQLGGIESTPLDWSTLIQQLRISAGASPTPQEPVEELAPETTRPVLRQVGEE